MTYTQKIIVSLLFISAYAAPNYGALATLRSAHRAYTKHGATLSRGAIWVLDSIYFAGKYSPKNIPAKVTDCSCAALGYTGLLHLGYQLDRMYEYACTGLQALENNRKLASIVALTESFCAGAFFFSALAMALASTHIILGDKFAARNIYDKTARLSDVTLALSVCLDCHRITQTHTPEYLRGASNLLLHILGYISIHQCSHNKDSFIDARNQWGMATLYGIRSFLLDVY